MTADTNDDLLDPASAPTSTAARMILAYLHDPGADENFAESAGNNAAWDTVATAVGPCPRPWICIAQHLAQFAADEMSENMGRDDAIEYMQALIAVSVDFRKS